MAYTGLLLASLGSILILVIGWYILQVVALADLRKGR